MEELSPTNEVEPQMFVVELDDAETAIGILSDLQNDYFKIENLIKIQGIIIYFNK